MALIYNIFGSKSSRDWDVMVLVNKIPETIEESQTLVKYNNYLLEEELLYKLQYDAKPINSNICEVENGIVTKVFKGTFDEVNNSLIQTYNNFKQQHSCLAEQKVNRDVSLKVLRCYRILLSFLSRTEMREEVKKGLSGNLVSKINVLNKIDFSIKLDLGTRNVTRENFYKMLAFQLGQTIALTSDIELYTKEDIDKYFNLNLHNCLMRHGISDPDFEYLEELKQKLIQITIKDFKQILNLNENTYEKVTINIIA